MRNYFLIIGSTSYFDDYLSKIDVEKDSFIELVRQDDTQRKGGVITWDPSPNLVVRNSDYHGLVASAHDRLGELIKEFTTEDAYIYIHNPPAALVRQLMAQYELGDIVVEKKNEEYDINRDPKAFAAGISEIQKKIIGQETAIKDISKSIWYLTKVNRKKPYVVMLYGNSSLGKTQLVREIAKSFFKSKYMEKHLSMFKNGNYAEYFFGNEPNRSSIGFELLERESNLVFLDEIDKCPEMFYSAFYTLFDNTVFKDYTYDVDISGVLIILTANYTSIPCISSFLAWLPSWAVGCSSSPSAAWLKWVTRADCCFSSSARFTADAQASRQFSSCSGLFHRAHSGFCHPNFAASSSVPTPARERPV